MEQSSTFHRVRIVQLNPFYGQKYNELHGMNGPLDKYRASITMLYLLAVILTTAPYEEEQTLIITIEPGQSVESVYNYRLSFYTPTSQS